MIFSKLTLIGNIYLTLCFIVVTGLSLAQMPTNILPYLKSKYSEARIGKMKKADGDYVVEFVNNNKRCRAYFNKIGNWLRTEIDLKWKTMPPVTRTALNRSDYAGWQVFDTKEVDLPADTLYMYEVNNGNGLEAIRAVAITEDYKVYFNSGGRIIKVEKVY